MTRLEQFVTACLIVGIVFLLFVLPAFDNQPTALRAWLSALTLFAAMSFLAFRCVAERCCGRVCRRFQVCVECSGLLAVACPIRC